MTAAPGGTSAPLGSYNLGDWTSADGDLTENTVAIRLGPRTHVHLVDSGGFFEGDSGTVDLYNYNYTDYYWEDVRFVDNSEIVDGVSWWSPQYLNLGWIRNDADSFTSEVIGPATNTVLTYASFGGLSGAKWGSSVDIVGNSVFVGASGKSRVAVYDLGSTTYSYWTVERRRPDRPPAAAVLHRGWLDGPGQRDCRERHGPLLCRCPERQLVVRPGVGLLQHWIRLGSSPASSTPIRRRLAGASGPPAPWQ